MGKASIEITAQDNASAVINNVAGRLGILNKAGLAMGVSFALINKGLDLVQQGFSDYVNNIKEGIDRSREFDLTMVRLSNTIDDFNGSSLNNLKSSLKDLSVTFGVDINTLANDMRMFTRDGYSVSESLDLMSKSNLLATATGDDLATTEDSISRIMKVFNLDATDSTYIIKKLGDLYGNTGWTIDEVNRLIGSNATEIKDAGVSFKTVSDILYDLEENGSNARDAMQGLKDALKDFKGVTGMELPTGAGLPEQLQKITGTRSFTETQLKALSGISQMELGSGWDQLTSQFSLQKITDAKKYFNLLNEDGINSLKSFNTEAGMAALKSENMDFSLIGVDKTVVQLIRSMFEYNDLVKQLDESTAASALKDQANALKEMTANLSKYNTENIGYLDEISDSTAQMNYLTGTRAITQEIQVQTDAIDKLKHVSDQYSLTAMGNNLEIMKIQYGAGSRGLTRGQQKQIDIIEKENLGLRIKEQEQQMAIGNIQVNGLYDMNKEMEQITRQHNTYMYNNELSDLKLFLDQKKELVRQNCVDIARIQNTISPGIGTVGVGGIPSWKWGSADAFAQAQARSMSQQIGDARIR